jgi:hypothetical protein
VPSTSEVNVTPSSTAAASSQFATSGVSSLEKKLTGGSSASTGDAGTLTAARHTAAPVTATARTARERVVVPNTRRRPPLTSAPCKD